MLLIPEDFRNDQYILQPLFKRLFDSFGKSKARIEVCRKPLFGGVVEALKSENVREVVQQYPMVDVFIFCVDRDGKPGRRKRLDEIESEFGESQTFLAENAWEELETWVLAGLDLLEGWNWQDVRGEIHTKETYFEPLAAERGLTGALGGGRKQLSEEAARRIEAIRQKCPQDFDTLARRIETAV